jgi:hypothetical protein
MSNEPLPAVVEASSPDAPKPGYRTSEFIGKCAVQAIAILVLTGIIPTADQSHANELALALITAIEAAYSFSRGMVKARR